MPVQTVAVAPVVDLATGGVIALHTSLSSLGAARTEALLPLVIDLPVQPVLGGSGALAPLHEALRSSGRRPREVILALRGTCGEQDRRALHVGLEGLRAIGYLLAFCGPGVDGLPLDVVSDASPYLLVIGQELMTARRGAAAEATVALARAMGAHVLAQGIEHESQLTAVREWGVRLAQGPLLAPGPNGRVRVPLPVPQQPGSAALLGPRVHELLLPAVTLPVEASAEEAVEAFGHEPSITSVILVDEYQRPKGSLDRSRFLLSFAARFGHALHGKKPALRLADPARTVPRTTPAIAAMQVAGRETDRVYDDLVVTDELNRCLGIVRVSDLIRHVADMGALRR